MVHRPNWAEWAVCASYHLQVSSQEHFNFRFFWSSNSHILIIRYRFAGSFFSPNTQLPRYVYYVLLLHIFISCFFNAPQKPILTIQRFWIIFSLLFFNTVEFIITLLKHSIGGCGLSKFLNTFIKYIPRIVQKTHEFVIKNCFHEIFRLFLMWYMCFFLPGCFFSRTESVDALMR